MKYKMTCGSFARGKRRSRVKQVIRHTPLIGKRYRPRRYGNKPILGVKQGRDVLRAAILRGEPFMAGRFGTSEGRLLAQYWDIRLRCGDDAANAYRLGDAETRVMCNNAGFFPEDKTALWKWAQMETEACRRVDLLGVMRFFNEEWIADCLCPQAQLMPNGGLGSASEGWAHVLENLRVLVVHPFTDTIQKQYAEHREEIFPGTNALPQFDLQCIKAVQTVAGIRDTRFADWFEALDYMTEEAARRSFDVCLIGCGAYGFQLASRIKQMGKIAVHMGGSLQTLFGIRGGRWDVKYNHMYNDAWVYPSETETPAGYENVEGGCYWKPPEKV